MIRVTLVLLALYFAGCKESVIVADPPAEAPISVNIIEEVKNRWSYYRFELNLDEYPFGHEYVPTYFDKLAARKELVKAWSQKTRPRLIFMGYEHVPLYNETVRDDPREIELQDRIYSMLVHNMQTVDLITFEDVGGTDPVTLGELVRAQNQITAEYRNHFQDFPILSHEQMLEMIRTNPSGVLHFMREHESPTLYFGEEWPYSLESALLYAFDSLPPAKKDIAARLIADFNRLRSEIMVIRTLEFLMRRRGDTAIMVQGLQHVTDMRALAIEYGFQLDTVLYRY